MSDKEMAELMKDALPFIAIGAAGGAVRALNSQPFSISKLIIRTITGGFVGAMLILWLSTLDYSIAVQGVICGAGGVVGTELLDAGIKCYKKKVVSYGKK